MGNDGFQVKLTILHYKQSKQYSVYAILSATELRDSLFSPTTHKQKKKILCEYSLESTLCMHCQILVKTPLY